MAARSPAELTEEQVEYLREFLRVTGADKFDVKEFDEEKEEEFLNS